MKRDMILDRVMLKEAKTQCRRGLIMDLIVHVVTDVNADLNKIDHLAWNPSRCTYL